MDEITKKIIGQRINTALANKDVKQKDLAKHLGVSDNIISYFVSGSRVPNTEQIIKISSFLDVSTDFILGLVNPKSSNTTIKEMCKYTGLSEESVEFLNSNVKAVSNLKEKAEERDNQFLNSEMKIAETKISIINDVFNSDDFHFALVNLSEYIVKSKEYIDEMSDILNQETLDKELFIKKLYLDNLKLKYYEAVNDLSDMVKKICDPLLCLSTGLNIETSIKRIHENIVDMVISFDEKESESNADNNQTE